MNWYMNFIIIIIIICEPSIAAALSYMKIFSSASNGINEYWLSLFCEFVHNIFNSQRQMTIVILENVDILQLYSNMWSFPMYFFQLYGKSKLMDISMFGQMNKFFTGIFFTMLELDATITLLRHGKFISGPLLRKRLWLYIEVSKFIRQYSIIDCYHYHRIILVSWHS